MQGCVSPEWDHTTAPAPLVLSAPSGWGNVEIFVHQICICASAPYLSHAGSAPELVVSKILLKGDKSQIMGMRTACGGSFWAVLGCTGTACQQVLWEALGWIPGIAQGEEKQSLTQDLLDWALESPKQGRGKGDTWRCNKDVAKAAKAVDF